MGARLTWKSMPNGLLLLNDTVVKSGKTVRLNAGPYKNYGSRYFKLWKMPMPIIRAIRRRHGHTDLHHHDTLPTKRPSRKSAHRISETFALPAPGVRMRNTFVFSDDNGDRSGKLTVSSFAKISAKLPLGIYLKVPGGIKLGAELFAFKANIETAIDPRIRIDVLTSWNGGLSDYLTEIYDETLVNLGEEKGAPLVRELQQALHLYLPASAPEGWEFTAPGEPISVEAGEPKDVEIDFTAETPGIYALALRASSLDDPAVQSVSDVMFIRRIHEQPARLLATVKDMREILGISDYGAVPVTSIRIP